MNSTKTSGITGRRVAKPSIDEISVAVIVPCYNEEVSIGKVIKDFRTVLPHALIYVYDNNSEDRTSEVARAEGAVVRTENRQGKGWVIRRAFSDISADIYLIVDGDDTYDANAAKDMIHLLLDGPFDFVNGARVHQSSAAYRPGHTFGNKMLTRIVGVIFGRYTNDMLSGYKVFTRRFVKSFPILSEGFEIETELMVHALELGVAIGEVQTRYRERPENSFSKLSTFKDGFKILKMIFRLVRFERPLLFFSMLAAVFGLAAVALMVPVVWEYFQTGLVERFPTAFLAGFLGISALFFISTGLILDLVKRGRHEAKMLAFLSNPML